ncbi:MAG: RsmE family RNA methyltransferase [Candidatus Sumerlaeota bacterium]
MRIYRCYNDSSPKLGDIVSLDDNEIQHLVAARRIRPGDKAILINGRGEEFLTTVAESHKRALTLRVQEIKRQQNPLGYSVRLVAAITKGPDFDDMFQRAVELGITHFQPLLSERVAVELDPYREDKRLERWRRLAVEALKQCERLWMPVIQRPLPVEEFLKSSTTEGERRVVLHERRSDISSLSQIAGAQQITIVTGPEGGWTAEESLLFTEHNCELASLTSEAILRAETAALTALAIVLSARG